MNIGILLLNIIGAEDMFLIIEDPIELSNDDVDALTARVEKKTGLTIAKIISIIESTPLYEA